MKILPKQSTLAPSFFRIAYLLLTTVVLMTSSSCRKNCDSCQILDETGNLSETGKVCDSEFVDKCQELEKRYKHISCDCQFQR